MTDAHDRAGVLAQRYADTLRYIEETCCRTGRDPREVNLLVVTKYHSADTVCDLIRAGACHFGENRAQEAQRKVRDVGKWNDTQNQKVVTGEPLRWDFIGQLQRKKCGSVARWADAVHSVDSLALVEKLDRAVALAHEREERSSSLGVYLQVSMDGDPARGGCPIDDLISLADSTAAAPYLDLRGVMAVPPLGTDPDIVFDQLWQLSQTLQQQHPHASGISAGMSGDMEAAIRHGSTCVRVGTAILGPRPGHPQEQRQETSHESW